MKEKRSLAVLRRAEHRTLCDLVVRSIEDAILEGRLPPGARLIEADIARQLEVSRPTVREALLILERLGLVVSQPRRGTFVTRISPRQVSEVLSARALLEGYAARLVSQKATEADFNRLLAQVETIACSMVPDSRAGVEQDVAFHDMLLEMSGHGYLQDIWHFVRSQVLMMLTLDHALVPGSPAWVPDEARRTHLEIVDALRSRDADEAQRAVVEHLANGERRVLMNLGAAESTPLVALDGLIGSLAGR